MVRRPPIDRIMSHVEKIDGGHWIWAAKGRTGLFNEYGGTRLNGKAMSSHRAVWILHNGPIPKGLSLLHQCEIKLCCNPDHLKLGTHKENLEEAVAVRGGIHWQTLLTGEKNRTCKLTDSDVVSLLGDVQSGMARNEIAKKYGVTTPYISMLANGKARAYLKAS